VPGAVGVHEARGLETVAVFKRKASYVPFAVVAAAAVAVVVVPAAVPREKPLQQTGGRESLGPPLSVQIHHAHDAATQILRGKI
jgi:hypothetical protein